MPMISGTLKFYDPIKGFGIAETAQGDLRIGHEAVAEALLSDMVGGAELKLEVLLGQSGLVVRKVIEAKFAFLKGIVKFFDETKNFGKIAALHGDDVHLPGDVAAAAGVLPWKGLVIEYLASVGKDGKPKATKVAFPTLDAKLAALADSNTTQVEPEPEAAPAAAYISAEVVVEKLTPALAEPLLAYANGETITGTVKWFNAQKGFGYIVAPGREGDLYVHASHVDGVGGKGKMAEGLAVVCDIGPGKDGKGLQALNLRLPGAPAIAESVPPKLAKRQRPVVKVPVRQFGGDAEPEAALAAVQKPTITRRARNKGGDKPASETTAVAGDSMVVVEELPDSPMAAGLAKLGLVAVAAKPNGLDHSAPEAGQPVH